MKITIHGPLAGYGPDGQIQSWAPDTLVEVDDKDEKAVAWARGWAGTPHATLVEDVPAKEPAKAAEEPARPEPHAARAETVKPSAAPGRSSK